MRGITLLVGAVVVAAGSAVAQPQAGGAANGHTEPNAARVRTQERRVGVAPPQGQTRQTDDELSRMSVQLQKQAAEDARAGAQAPKPVPP